MFLSQATEDLLTDAIPEVETTDGEDALVKELALASSRSLTACENRRTG